MASEKTDKEIDALVAENLMGYRWMRNKIDRVGERDGKKIFPVGYLFLVPPHDFKSSYFGRARCGDRRNKHQFDFVEEQFSTKLSDSALMEKTIEAKCSKDEYIEALCNIVSGRWFPDTYHDVWALMQATPRERCIAALRVLGIEVK